MKRAERKRSREIKKKKREKRNSEENLIARKEGVRSVVFDGK